jgi:spore germination protein GerM
MKSRGALLVALASVVIACTATGCAPRPQSEHREIDPAEVPFGLLEDRHGLPESSSGTSSLTLYFVGTDGLVPVFHPITRSPDASTALRQLLDGPTELDLEQGLGTELPSRRAARLVGNDAGLARVELETGFDNGAITDQGTALGQIVLTLTAVPGVDEVSFLVAGRQAAVPRADGSLTEGPVDREDYAALTGGS